MSVLRKSVVPHRGGKYNKTDSQLGRTCAPPGTFVHHKKTLDPDLNTITIISVMRQMTFLEWKTPLNGFNASLVAVNVI